ncbi:MAG: sugar ABC transporter permease [Clostridia bacterium]|nr:sugar ABC transporter permease [Clostridia bacterium]
MEMKRKEFIAFTAPSMLIMAALMIAPLILTFYLSFMNFTYGSNPQYIGLKNYIDILTNVRFWNATAFTLLITAVTTFAKIAIGFGIALLLYNITKFRGIFIAGSLLPFIVPPVVGTLIFGWLFRQHWGYVSYLLNQIGIDISWYADPWAARWLIMMHVIWQGTSFVFLVLYAGLQAMSKESLEAAVVDGATYFQQVVYVIIPYLKPLFLFVTMIMVMDAYRLFDNIAVMTKGGPGLATETLMYYNYQIAFGRLSLGAGSAISVLTMIGIFILMAPFLYWTYKEQTEK